jgi:hypothetical protein
MLPRALVVVAVLAACGDDGGSGAVDAAVDVPPGAVPREVIMEDVPLVVDEVVEAILVGGPEDYARITATVPIPSFDWNIHGHANGETQIVGEAFKVTTMDYVFVPPAQADWYLLLRNKGQTDNTIELKIELFGDMTWSGWQ